MSRVFVRRSGGVSRIVRDTYGKNWWTLGKEIRERDGNRCSTPGCNTYVGSGGDVHHVRPLSRGGVTAKSNLVLLCEKCHQRKHRHKIGIFK